jgi:quinol monooxygenase YgiN
MSKLWISAGLKVTSAKPVEEIKQALIELQAQTVQEPGCLFFDVLQHRDHPQLFTLWEEWINEDALKNHFEMAHTKAYLTQSLTEVMYIEKLEKRT